MDGERPPPGGGDGPGRHPNNKLPSDAGDEATQGARRGGGPQHEVLGDPNLGIMIMILALLGIMQRLMAPPCTC